MAEGNAEQPNAVPDVAAVSDKPAPRKVPRRPTRIKPKPKEGSSGKRWESWKIGSETALSIVKIVTLLVVTVAVGLLVGTVVLRDRGQRQVIVEIEPKVEKLFFELGVDFDLRSAVRDEAHSRINGVKSFLEASLFKNIDVGVSQAVSFKPFGIDVTTNDVTGLARLLLGGEPEFRVRFELLCGPGPCESPRYGTQRAVERITRLTLIAHVSGPERGERLVFPTSTRPLALRRALRVATQRTAEKLLELSDPMIASVLYNNVPDTIDFGDEQRRYAVLAAGAAYLVRREASDRVCLSEIVLGDSLIQRGDVEGGTQKLSEIAEDSERILGTSWSISARRKARTCRIQAKTDQAIHQLRRICETSSSADASGKQKLTLSDITKEMVELWGFAQGGSEIERARIKDILAYSNFLKILFADDSAALTAVCKRYSENILLPYSPLRSGRIALAQQEFVRLLPPSALQKTAADAFSMLAEYVGVAVPNASFIERFDILQKAAQVIDQYANKSANPGSNYLASGKVIAEIANIVRDVLGSKNEEEMKRFVIRWQGNERDVLALTAQEIQTALHGELARSLSDARIAFENASSAESRYPSFEMSPKMQALISLGDRYYADGFDKSFVGEAEKSYAGALRLFIEQDAPVRDFKFIAKAAARWMIVRHREGACKVPKERNVRWDQTWTLLGAASDHDWCPIMMPDQSIPAENLGILGVLGPYIRDIAARCQTSMKVIKPLPEEALRKFDLMRCVDGADAKAAEKFFQRYSGSEVDRMIGRALAGEP